MNENSIIHNGENLLVIDAVKQQNNERERDRKLRRQRNDKGIEVVITKKTRTKAKDADIVGKYIIFNPALANKVRQEFETAGNKHTLNYNITIARPFQIFDEGI